MIEHFSDVSGTTVNQISIWHEESHRVEQNALSVLQCPRISLSGFSEYDSAKHMTLDLPMITGLRLVGRMLVSKHLQE